MIIFYKRRNVLWAMAKEILIFSSEYQDLQSVGITWTQTTAADDGGKH